MKHRNVFLAKDPYCNSRTRETQKLTNLRVSQIKFNFINIVVFISFKYILGVNRIGNTITVCEMSPVSENAISF